MNIIFRPHFFGGKNNDYDKTFVPMSLKSVLKYNPDSIIYFISNDKNFMENIFPSNIPDKLKCYLFEDFEDENTQFFDKNYVHLSTNQFLFEKYAILGYFYIYNLMLKFNLNEAIIIESDVLIFCNLNEIFSKYFDIINNDAILSKKNIICSSYVKKIYLENFVNTTIKMFSDKDVLNYLKKIFSTMKSGGICDMTINNWINNENLYNGLFTKLNSENKKINIEELSVILPDHSYFDGQLSRLDCENIFFDSEENKTVGKIKKIYNINNQPYFKYNEQFIKCNSIHFQGAKKLIMPELYFEYIN